MFRTLTSAYLLIYFFDLLNYIKSYSGYLDISFFVRFSLSCFERSAHKKLTRFRVLTFLSFVDNVGLLVRLLFFRFFSFFSFIH